RQRRVARLTADGINVFVGAMFRVTRKQHAVIEGELGPDAALLNFDELYADVDEQHVRGHQRPRDLLKTLIGAAKRAAAGKRDLLSGPDDWQATQAKMASWHQPAEL